MTNEELLKKIEDAAARKTTELDLRNHGLTKLPQELFQLTELTHLCLGDNNLTELPPELCNLIKLTRLELWKNQLSRLPAEICQLKNLSALDLSGNKLTLIPQEIFCITSLNSLNLSCNQLTELSLETFRLIKLTEIDIWENQLKFLPHEISKLVNLRILNIGRNQLTCLPEAIGQLIHLEHLNASSNQLNCLPPEFGNLTKLSILDLRENQLRSLPSGFGKLNNLYRLDLWDNRLKSLPSEIGQLTNLTQLHLYNNKLTSLPPEIGKLTKLERLYLWGNQLTKLPREICQLTKLERLSLDDEALFTFPPPEIVKKGAKVIRQYLAALQEGDAPLNEMKILLVGEGAAGKTSLVRRLLGRGFDPNENATHGINIRGWEQNVNNRRIRINIWDFGGQEIMHATHQFFLSKRSLYILVLDGRRDERTEYWLQHIKSFGGSSPVLVVLNKYDTNPGFDINRPFLQAKYPSIRGFFHTSCKTERGISRFKTALLKELVRGEMINTRWPASWLQVKERIAQLNKPHISVSEYKGICEGAEITEQADQENLVDRLHDLGVAIHFKDFPLDATYALDPAWVTSAVYKIINDENVAVDKGILNLDSLKDILRKDGKEKYEYPQKRHEYPQETHVFIIELMKKFELCYEVDKRRVLIPQLLSVVEPDFKFNYGNCLQFVLHYHDFLPPSVLPRFIVKRHQEIKESRDRLVWRTGVVLLDKKSGSEAVIRLDSEAKRIYLLVNGPSRKEYLTFIWFTLREINDSFEKLNVSERIPMPDDPTVTADYQTLLNHLKAGMDKYMPEGSENVYQVKELLGLVEPDREDQIIRFLQMIKAQHDEKEILELKPNWNGIGIDLKELFRRIKAGEDIF